MTAASIHRSILGESPLWDESTETMWWVDIKDHTIHQVAFGTHTEYKLSIRPSAIGLTNTEQLIVAGDNGLYLYNPETDELKLLASIPEPGSNRTNDGKVGPDGAFWFGTMDDAEIKTSGALYSYHPQRGLQKHLDGIKIANTFAWSPDGTWMYFADSAQQTIWQMTFDVETGTLGDREVFVSLKNTNYYPDGSAMDANGCLWNAQWGGSRIVQYAPNSAVMKIFTFPTSQITNCAFVGSKLLITTASIGLDDDPIAGQTILTETNVQGAVIPRFILS